MLLIGERYIHLCILGEMIKEYFLNYEAFNNDFTINLGKMHNMVFNSSHDESDWIVTLHNTGENTQTGARIKRVEQYIDGDIFLATYGDGVANINISNLVEFHKSHGKIGTISGVHPPSRFGELGIKDNQVYRFHEKPQVMEGMINGGYFVFNREFLDYLSHDENCILEREPLNELTRAGQLMVYAHDDFWQCVDTNRELELLNTLWDSGEVPWKVW